MKSEVEVFRDYVRQRGLRWTPERKLILQKIFEIHEHFDVDSLHWLLKQKGVKVSKASIYRALRLFIDCGLVREVDFSDGHWHYEHIYGHEHHNHMKCLGCGEVREFEEPILAQVDQRLTREYGYNIVFHQLEVRGYCPICQKAGEKTPAR
jgi:Fur family ferric uptake transcriptional regulator